MSETLKGLACKVVIQDVLDAEEAVIVKRKRLEQLKRIEAQYEKIMVYNILYECQADDCEAFVFNGRTFGCGSIIECDDCSLAFCDYHTNLCYTKKKLLCKDCRGE